MLRLGSPLRVNLELTEACNNVCVHCYNFWRYQEVGPLASVDDHSRSIEHFMSILNILIAKEVRVVTFTGGEPFLRRDVLLPLVARAKASGMKVFINTNATLITADDVAKLNELEVDGFLVSLLSADESTHNAMTNSRSYTRTMQGISMLVKAGHSVSINMVTSRDNYQQVRMTAQKMSMMGVHSFSATPMLSCYLSAEHEAITLTSEQFKQTMRDLIWAKGNLPMQVTVLDTVVPCMFDIEEREEFETVLGLRYCCAGISDCAVSPDGDLRPCILATDKGGNILQEGWEKPWANLAFWKEPSMLPDDCLKCTAVDSCGGGCRAAAKASTGSYRGRDPYMREPILEKPGVKGNEGPRGPVITMDDLLSGHPALAWRDEPFGGTLFQDDDHIFLHKEPYDFLIEALNDSPFSANSIVEKYGIATSDVLSFFQVLVDGGFLVTMSRGGDKK